MNNINFLDGAIENFIENNIFNYVDFISIEGSLKIIGKKCYVISQYTHRKYRESEFIEIVKRHKSRNKELFNILKEYNPEYFI